jgi:hypothetical protein
MDEKDQDKNEEFNANEHENEKEKRSNYEPDSDFEKDSDESDLNKEEKERIDSDEEEIKNEKEPIKKSDSLNNDHYRQLAFYGLIDADDSLNIIKVLQTDLNTTFSNKETKINELFKLKIKRIEEKISIIEEKLKSQKDSLEKFKKGKEELENEKKSILNQLSNLKKELYKEYEKLADGKKDLFEKRLGARLEEINSEISKLLNNYQLLSEKKAEINKKVVNENRESIAKKINRFESKRKQIEDFSLLIYNKLKDLYNAGFSESFFSFISVVGYISLISAGWFFSIYIVEKDLQSEDYLTFILVRIFTFGSQIFSEGNMFINFLILLSGLISILLIITMLIWITDLIIQSKNKVYFNLVTYITAEESDNESLYWSPLFNNSYLIPWINRLPIIFIIGLIFILLSLFGTNPPDINKLMMSLSAQFIGAALTLSITGLMIFYITKVIEPRFGKENKDESVIKFLTKNWELSFSIISFIAVILLLIFINIENSTIALIIYFIITITTSFTLGYALKYRGLINVAEKIEKSLKNLSIAIEDHLRQTTLDSKSIETKSFKDKFEKCLEDFWRMIFIRNRLVEELLVDRAKKPNKLLKWIDVFFNQKDSPSLEIRELSVIEEIYFPVNKKIIEDLKDDWKRNFSLYENKIKEIKRIKYGESNFEKIKLREIKLLEDKINNLKKVIISINENLNNELDKNNLNKEKCKSDLNDGIDLGLWYRKIKNISVSSGFTV